MRKDVREMEYFTMNLQPMRHMHQYIPSMAINGAGLTNDGEAAYRFAQQMFVAGTEWQRNVIGKVFTDRPKDTDWRNLDNVAFWKALKDATKRYAIEDDDNVRTFGAACFKGGKRYCLNTFSALCDDVLKLPF